MSDLKSTSAELISKAASMETLVDSVATNSTMMTKRGEADCVSKTFDRQTAKA
jgi:hypothetical protein